MTNDVPAGRFAITVDWPTGKPTVEVSGLGVFPNHETTELTEEQVYHWFNRTGAQPLAQFPEGITIVELSADAPKAKAAAPVEDKDEASAEGAATQKDGV
jgi:hypothetical protein